jgi:hypothetical protein
MQLFRSEMRVRLRRSAFPLLPALYLLFITIDIVGSFGLSNAPEAVGRLACDIAPLTTISTFLIPSHWLDVVAYQCLGSASEPAVSVIFLMTKISLAIAAFPVLVLLTAIRPEAYRALRNDALNSLQEKTYLRKLAENAFALAFFGMLMAGFWWASLWRSADRFNTDLLHKTVNEDLFCCLVFVMTLLFSLLFLHLTAFPVEHWLEEKRK